MEIIDINGSRRTVISCGPDPKNPGYILLQFKSHTEWMTCDEFAERNPDQAAVSAKVAPAAPDTLGVVTSARASTLTDNQASWDRDVYQGYTVWISRGVGEGQKRVILKNTDKTLTVNEPWEIVPTHFSQYVIAHHIKDVPARGNTLPQADTYTLEEESKKIDRSRGILKPDEFYHPKS